MVCVVHAESIDCRDDKGASVQVHFWQSTNFGLIEPRACSIRFATQHPYVSQPTVRALIDWCTCGT
jgi:hypothetical protein